MDIKKNFNWKTAAIPAVAATAALAVGIAYYAGGSTQDTETGSKPAEVNFSQSPNYAPGQNPLARSAQPQASSIEIFRSVNKGYSTDTAAAPVKLRQAVKPKNRKDLQDFLAQVRHNINYETAAPEAPEGGGVTPQPGERRVYNPAGLGSRSAGKAAALRQSSIPRLNASAGGHQAGGLGGKNSSFTVGTFGGDGPPPALHGPAAARQQHEADVAAAASGGDGAGASSSGSGQGGAGGGSGLAAGEYGSHGGGGGSRTSTAGAMKQAQAEEKAPPAPVAYIWPRSVDFGGMAINETSNRLVVVMNIGDAPLVIGAIENIDDASQFFLQADKCSSSTLAPGKSCTFQIKFAPQAAKEHVTAFYIPTNDEGSSYYQTYMEIKGKAAASQWTSWWGHWGGQAAGRVNKADFGMVSEGQSLTETVRVTNTSGQGWYNLKLNSAKLPACFRISGDNCTGTTLGAGQSCAATVTFTPNGAVNARFAGANYGQYLSQNTETNTKVYSARPKYPPLLMEAPVEAEPAGSFAVLASYNEEFYTGQQEVAEVRVSGRSTAPFPVQGLTRIHVYYYFK